MPMAHRAISNRSKLERATQWHVVTFVIAAAWMFGGRIDWAVPILISWGAVGALLTLYGLIDRRQRGAPVKRWLIWLAAPLLLALWVLVSSFNSSFEIIWFYEREVFRPRDVINWLPTSATPDLTRSELALGLGLFLSAFNLCLNVEKRRTLRNITLYLGGNACVLALFGTVQKMAGTEMFFGLQESPNDSFFASFIYHNHWGPFALLSIAGWFGLIEYLSKEDRGRGFLHSPAFSAIIAILLIAVTIPLSTSRSSTMMLVVLLVFGGFWLLWRIGRRRVKPISRAILASTGLAAVVFFGASAYWLGGDTIRHRIGDTKQQIAAMQEMGGIGQRARVYGDTITFIQAHPIAGWGLESYGFVYRRYNTEPKTVEGWTVQFDEAHSDWLQLLAEVGLVGTLLFLITIIVPLKSVRRHLFDDPYAGVPFFCLLLLALFAWVEFPFANPAVSLAAWVTFFGAIRYLQLGGSVQPHPTDS